ncbi:hypothetical protein ABZ858_01220 [Streptomyces sp. NPDC047017]|uniref:hypothetical protein n=1 Tax=Streptomyces sp. NPDC047017 TaxID=3155024 RepID=UPI0033C9E560
MSAAEDIVAGHDDTDVVSALTLLRDQLRQWGIKVIFTTPTVGYADAESAVAVTDAASTSDPAPLMLNAGAAPNDYDSGDHVNLTADGYSAVTDAIDLTALGPDS